jgi:hypothetical protein
LLAQKLMGDNSTQVFCYVRRSLVACVAQPRAVAPGGTVNKMGYVVLVRSFGTEFSIRAIDGESIQP